MKTFTNQFDITFNPNTIGVDSFSKKRVRMTVELKNVISVHRAKEVLAEQGIFATSLKRLN